MLKLKTGLMQRNVSDKSWQIGFWLLSLVLLLSAGCGPATQNPEKRIKYTGPIMETTNVSTLYSDSARLKIKLSAPLQQQYENGNGIYPKGFNLTFLDDLGNVATTLRANYGKYDKTTDSYLARGNVVVKNIAKNETLETEELRWLKQSRKIRTNKFVKIRTAEEILTGQGLEANQDFSRYRILKPAGVFSVKQ
jgi:LPS export ABC transporter protein LptC